MVNHILEKNLLKKYSAVTRMKRANVLLYSVQRVNFYSRQQLNILFPEGAQWLSGRVLDSRLRDQGFKPNQCLYVVSLSKTHLSLLSSGSTQEDPYQHN